MGKDTKRRNTRKTEAAYREKAKTAVEQTLAKSAGLALGDTPASSRVTPSIIPTGDRERGDFYNMPDTPASDLILESLGAGANIADLPARKRQVNHNTTLQVLEDGSRRQVLLYSGKNSVTLELDDIDRLTGSNKPAKKLFVLSLIKANEQAIHGGQLTRNYITFPLQELVDIGFYKSKNSARTGFNAGADALTSIKIKGHLQIKQGKRKSQAIKQDVLEVLFTGARIDNNQCFIFFNDRINWDFLAHYFTILPRYYFALPNRASDLLYYIFYLARQNAEKIAERGYFTISFRAIQSRLQLPNEKGLNNPQRDIKQPIEDAIEQIEDGHSLTYNNQDFALLPVYKENAPISEYLDTGYLQVTLKGAFADVFIEIAHDAEKKIDTAKKKQARIEEKARATNLAKKLEAEEQAKKETEGSGTE